MIPYRSNAWYGYRRDASDARDLKFRSTISELPATVDLRHNCPPIMDQGALGSCTAHGVTAALRYTMLKNGRPDVELSRLQLYYDERALEGSINDDAGAQIRDGIKAAAKVGVGHERLWPYDIKRFTDKPPQACYVDAVNFNAIKYERVRVGVTSLKAALASGYPVVFGITLYDSFESPDVEKTGVVPMPNLEYEAVVGGHCMLAVGYGQKNGYFTVQNSWADDWGDKGFCYIPERMLGSAKYTGDCWIIKQVG